MLLELRVENLLLIDRAELRLGPGLNAITGETGAGKTVLAHALGLLRGGTPTALRGARVLPPPDGPGGAQARAGPQRDHRRGGRGQDRARARARPPARRQAA